MLLFNLAISDLVRVVAESVAVSAALKMPIRDFLTPGDNRALWKEIDHIPGTVFTGDTDLLGSLRHLG